MSHILAIAKKELRAYFLSPVALIFLATFLFVTLFTFFWVEAFFTRNIADIRPLFSWLPILLIFLVAALTMRLWSEEQKLGTLEILMTMPVETHRLVLGKFLGGLGLVALALALTLGVPMTVSLLGELDWGPVFGGYLAALLLAGAYLSIGLTLSSLTDNQIVALILTVLACGFLYVVGTDPVTGLFDTRGAELLRAIGIGSRFESIGRGVIDVRDLVYYGSLIVLFLALNTVILESKRWSDGASTRSVRTGARVMVGLALANLLVLNLWLGQSGRVRVDLTSRGEYSISKTTEGLVKGLPNPLLLRGYFSAKTHPLLAPLVPRIKDLMQEYAALSAAT
jgi:ABC-2 type transport system permease protein